MDIGFYLAFRKRYFVQVRPSKSVQLRTTKFGINFNYGAAPPIDGACYHSIFWWCEKA